MVNSRKKPSFRRWLSQAYARVDTSWRRPRGHTNKVIRKEKGKDRMPGIGWGADNATRGLHPIGYFEVVINNANDLQKIDTKTQVAKVSGTVGKKKKAEIVKKAEEMKIKILNPGLRAN